MEFLILLNGTKTIIIMIKNKLKLGMLIRYVGLPLAWSLEKRKVIDLILKKRINN